MPDEFFNEHNNPSPRRPESLLAESTSFRGDRNDLEAFVRLVSTPIRHAARSEALHEWKAYNKIPTLHRGKGVKARSRYRGIDLRGADLHNLYVGYVDLRDAQLDGADLRGARMKGARLDGASLEGARLDGVYFAFASLANANLANTSAREANFLEAKLIGTNFSKSDLTGALLADTQRRDWNLRGVLCEYVYWSLSKPKTTYPPGEFESLFSEEAMVTLESSGHISDQELSNIPMLVQALKRHHGAVLRLHNIQDSDGKFLVRLRIEDSAGITLDVLRSELAKISSTLNIGSVGLLIQNQQQQEGTPMGTFNTTITNANVVNQTAGNATINMRDNNIGDVAMEPKTAKCLEDIVANKKPEAPGFSDELKSEVVNALKAIALEQAKTLPAKAYSLIREFFPSYVKALLP